MRLHRGASALVDDMRPHRGRGGSVSLKQRVRPGGTFARALAALAGALWCAACAAPLPSTELPPTRQVAPALEFPELRDYRGIVDCRIRPLEQEASADLAGNAQIDFIVLGDRARPGDTDYGTPGFTSEILFIPGASFESGGAEIVGINLKMPIALGKSPPELIAAIHDQGGLAIAAEPARFKSPDDYAVADAIEVYNQHSAWDAQSRWPLYWRALLTSTDRFLVRLDEIPAPNIAVYDAMTRGARVTLLAGMGAADNLSVVGARVATFPQLFLFFTTHVLAPERNTDPIVDGLKRGHVYVSFDLLGYVGEFAFYAQNGGSKVMMGDETRLEPGLALKAELPAPADRIVLLQDGAEAASAEQAATLEFAPKAAGAYRIVAYRGGRPWILSNPVYVR
jgi:hypothetical protein